MPEVDGPVNLYFLLSIMSASIVMFIALFFNVAEGFKEFELLWDRIALSTKGSGRIAIWITLSYDFTFVCLRLCLTSHFEIVGHVSSSKTCSHSASFLMSMLLCHTVGANVATAFPLD